MFNFVNNLRSGIFQLLSSKTIQNTGVVFGGNIIASGFSLITILILTKTLSPETFGILSLVSSVALLLISLTDFGIAVGLSKFVIPMEDKSSAKAVSFFRTVFWIEIFLGITTILLGLIFLDPISYWLGGSKLKGPLALGFIIAGLLSFYAYVSVVLQTLQKFWTLTALNIFSNLFKLTMVATLFYTGYLTLWNTLYINLFSALAILLCGLLIVPKFFIGIVWKEDINSAGKLFSFTKWLAISYALNAIASRLDILMLSHFRTSLEVGYYALAFQLSAAFPLLLGAVSTVLIPKVSNLKTGDQLGKYIIKSLKSSIFIVPLILVGIIISPVVVKALFGSRYIFSIPILQIFLLNYLLILIINPISLVMYALGKQKLLVFINTISLFTLFILQIYLIPGFGGVGAAISLLFNTMLAMLILVCFLFLFYNQGKIKI